MHKTNLQMKQQGPQFAPDAYDAWKAAARQLLSGETARGEASLGHAWNGELVEPGAGKK